MPRVPALARGSRGRIAASLLLSVSGIVAGPSLPFGRPNVDVVAATPAQIGFSFSPRSANYQGEDSSSAALQTLLDQLSPDVVRLPVYWDSVEATKGTFDFTETDDMVEVIQNYNLTRATRPTKIILVVGVRNIGYPELYMPDWVSFLERDPAALMVQDPEYRQYLKASVAHYSHNPLLYSWQLENEALDDVPTILGTMTQVPAEDLQDEIETVRSIDSQHPVVVTTFNSSGLYLDLVGMAPATNARPATLPQPAGHPLQTLQIGDALGLDIYVVTGDTSLNDASATTRIDWKKATLKYWAAQAQRVNKPLWITEMQGAPWPGHSDFTTDDLVYSARQYRGTGASVVLLWGVESWVGNDAWMKAGREARQILSG